MNKLMVQMTTGRGPIECEYFLAKIYEKFSDFLQENSLNFVEMDRVTGEKPDVYQSITLDLPGSASLSILKPWLGSLLWICKSPFRPQCKRKNWFIQISAHEPSTANAILSNHEIKTESFRSQGKGGQHINKTNSAIRITHMPTGVVVIAQDERSQHRNKELALRRLKLKLALLQQENEMNTIKALRNQHDQLQRGQAIKIFVGPKFIEQKSEKSNQ